MNKKTNKIAWVILRAQERTEEHIEKRHKKAEKARAKVILQLHHDLESF